jgi:tRNA 5-methylaminomethyl-2-thiouridine biosynthesis bifunctional protein
VYDYAIIGAGINGCFTAYRLQQAGKKVILLDPKGIGGSGSHAAGAFLSPKVGKGGDLKSIVNQAYDTAIDFYKTLPDSIFTQNGLLHFPKNSEDAKEFPAFKSYADNDFRTPAAEELSLLKEQDLAAEGLFFKDAGIIDPMALCHYLAKGIDFEAEMLTSLLWSQTGNYWDLNLCQAHHLILASGAYTPAIREEHVKLRAVWGERIEITTQTPISINYHQNISISTTKKDGRVVIGATHEQHQFDKELNPDQAEHLLSLASNIMDLKEVTVVDHRGGVRAGSFDYLPIVGPIIDSEKSLAKFPKLITGAKVDEKQLCYHPNVYMINGVGGRGFVLAPMLSQYLVEHLLDDTEIDRRITPYRLFKRWVKRQIKEKQS